MLGYGNVCASDVRLVIDTCGGCAFWYWCSSNASMVILSIVERLWLPLSDRHGIGMSGERYSISKVGCLVRILVVQRAVSTSRAVLRL